MITTAYLKNMQKHGSSVLSHWVNKIQNLRQKSQSKKQEAELDFKIGPGGKKVLIPGAKIQGLNFEIGLNDETEAYILGLYREIKNDFDNALKKAIHLGKILNKLKWHGIGGGAWKNYLDRKFPEISYRSCAIYMQLADNEKEVLGAKSISEALKIIASLKPEEPKKFRGQPAYVPETWTELYNDFCRLHSSDNHILGLLKHLNDNLTNKEKRMDYCRNEEAEVKSYLKLVGILLKRLNKSDDDPVNTINVTPPQLALPAPLTTERPTTEPTEKKPLNFLEYFGKVPE